MRTKNYIVLLALLLIIPLYGQKVNLSKAKKEYENLSFVKTTEKLLQVAESGSASPEVLEQLANAYYFNSKMDQASRWYGSLLENESKSIDPETYYRYAMSLKAIGSYEKSNAILEAFSDLKPEDIRGQLFKGNRDYLQEIFDKQIVYELTHLEINTSYSDFGTSFYEGGIVFASSRNTEGDLYKWNEQPFLDLFYTDHGSSKLKRLGGAINTRYHESSTSFTNDGKGLYFTRNNYYKGRVKKSKKHVNGLKIFKASKTGNNSWGNILPMPFNSNNYNVAHPALSPDNSKLYFASDMPGTLGGSDIFVVDILEDGSYSEPRNLGLGVNTEGRENFPYVSADNILYFSSDGQLGLGGLDVFKIDLNDPESKAENLGKPINSPKDDFEFIINSKTDSGYLTSNRPGGKGDDDIYSFGKIVCNQKVSGRVVDASTGALIPEASVMVYNSLEQRIENLISDSKGGFRYDSNCEGGEFKAVGSKQGYSSSSKVFKLEGRNGVELQLELKAEVVEVGTDLAKILNLNPIYFDFDKSYIRSDAALELQKVLDYMQSYPDLKVDVRSHTDSRGRDNYNFTLSNRRNTSTVQWLIDQGIAPDRLTGRGYGETQLVNGCRNGVKCSDEEHQLNRRSEFIVVEN